MQFMCARSMVNSCLVLSSSHPLVSVLSSLILSSLVSSRLASPLASLLASSPLASGLALPRLSRLSPLEFRLFSPLASPAAPVAAGTHSCKLHT